MARRELELCYLGRFPQLFPDSGPPFLVELAKEIVAALASGGLLLPGDDGLGSLSH